MQAAAQILKQLATGACCLAGLLCAWRMKTRAAVLPSLTMAMLPQTGRVPGRLEAEEAWPIEISRCVNMATTAGAKIAQAHIMQVFNSRLT